VPDGTGFGGARVFLTDEEYRDLKQRFRAGEFPFELDRVIRRLVRVNAFSGTISSRLAPGGFWNQASVEDATQGFYEKRLLQGGLAAAFDQAASARSFLRRLELSFRHYLQNERDRSESQNLYRRTGELLVSEPEFRNFVPEGTPGGAWWGLSTWIEPSLYQGSDDTLVRASWRTGDYDLFLYGPKSERLDPVLRSPDLKRFLISLFDEVGALLTRTHLAIVLERRFNLDAVGEVPLGESTAPEIAIPEEEIDEERVEQVARSVLAQISLQESELLFRRFQGAKLKALSEAFGTPTSSIDYQIKRVARLIERESTYDAPPMKIMEKLLDLLSIGVDGD
jgi:hypothetical protein